MGQNSRPLVTKNTGFEYVKAAIKLATKDEDEVLAEPYTPKIESLKLKYSSTETLLLDASQNLAAIFENRVERLYQLSSFGSREVHPSTEKNNEVKLLNSYDHGGALFIGLENLEPPQNLSLLFTIAEGSADPDKTMPEIRWHYLSSNSWQKLESNQILSDNTLNLTKSGIITLEMPEDMNLGNSLLSGDYHWIRASVEMNADAVNQLVSIDSQAIQVVFENQGNAQDYLSNPLEAGSISKLREKLNTVKKITQPFASYGGKVAEKEDEFYQRVSERLRHKKRPITMWDYERLVLEEFPSIHKVKCLSHTSNETEIAPGNVTLVVISNLRNQNAVNPLEPKTSVATLAEIEEKLAVVKNPFVELTVRNPVFEQVQVAFDVEFKTGVDKGIYLKQLNEDIVKFLSPWAFEEGEDIAFEGTVYKSVILNFVENLDYVDFVTCFKMYQYMADGTRCEESEEAAPTKAVAILVSIENHDIGLVENADCSCEETATA